MSLLPAYMYVCIMKFINYGGQNTASDLSTEPYKAKAKDADDVSGLSVGYFPRSMARKPRQCWDPTLLGLVKKWII